MKQLIVTKLSQFLMVNMKKFDGTFFTFCRSNLLFFFFFFFFFFVLSSKRHVKCIFTELQIRGGIEDNSKIFFLISQRKHILWSLIRIVSTRRFQ